MAYKESMTFVELHGFAKKVAGLLDDASLLGLQIELIQRPEVGIVIRNGGGLRKVRWSAIGKGKSGGVRVIYFYQKADGQILLVDIFQKNEKENLSESELASLRKQIEK